MKPKFKKGDIVRRVRTGYTFSREDGSYSVLANSLYLIIEVTESGNLRLYSDKGIERFEHFKWDGRYFEVVSKFDNLEFDDKKVLIKLLQ